MEKIMEKIPRKFWKNVEKLYNVNSTEIMKFIVSGGVSDLHYYKNPKVNKEEVKSITPKDNI